MIFSPTLPGEIYRFTESSVPHFKHCISPSCKPLFRIKRCPRMKPVRQLNRYRKTNEPAYFHTETDSLTITVAFTAYRQRYKPPIEQPYRDSHVFRKPESGNGFLRVCATPKNKYVCNRSLRAGRRQIVYQSITIGCRTLFFRPAPPKSPCAAEYTQLLLQQTNKATDMIAVTNCVMDLNSQRQRTDAVCFLYASHCKNGQQMLSSPCCMQRKRGKRCPRQHRYVERVRRAVRLRKQL